MGKNNLSPQVTFGEGLGNKDTVFFIAFRSIFLGLIKNFWRSYCE